MCIRNNDVIKSHRIHDEHAILKLDDKTGIIKIRPFTKECRILVNGAAINGETDLDHNDRIVFGSTHIWVFQNPNEKGINKKQYPPITFEYAQEEIAAKGILPFFKNCISLPNY